MTPQELRESIIRSAMKGQLVKYNIAEGTGTDLYNKIIEFKQSNSIRDHNKLQPISEEEQPFEIPEHWIWVRLGDIVDYKMGKTPPRAETEWWNGDYPWVSIADMPESGHIYNTKESVSRLAIEKKFGNRISKAGTLIMSFKLTVGKVSILDIDAVHNEAIISIYPFCDENRIIQDYLFSILPIVTQFGNRKNAIKGKTLNDTSICNLLIPLPPLTEQRCIVKKIEELLRYIECYDEAYTKLQAFNKRFPVDMQKSILQTAIQGKLVEQLPEEGTGEELYQQIQDEKQQLIKHKKIRKGKPLSEITEDEIQFDIPDSWKWVRLPSISTSCLGKMLDKQKNTGTLMPYLRNINVRWGNFDLSDLQEMKFEDVEDDRFLIKYGDLVMCEGGEPGRCAVWKSNQTIHFQKALHRIRFFHNVEPDFFYYIFWFYAVSGRLNRLFTGTTIKHLTGQALDKILVPLPPYAEQKRIVDKLEEILPLCERLR